MRRTPSPRTTRLQCVALALLALAAATAAAAEDSAKVDQSGHLVVPGVVSIPSPGKGFIWRSVAPWTSERGGQYQCDSDKGNGDKVIVGIDPRHLPDAAHRVATLKAHWNAIVQTLQKSGYTDLKGTPPKFETPVPDDVPFSMFGKSPTGEVRHFAFHTVFGHHTYLVQAAAGSQQDAQTFSDVAKNLKEPAAESH